MKVFIPCYYLMEKIVNKGHHLDLKGKFYSVKRKLRNPKKEMSFFQKS